MHFQNAPSKSQGDRGFSLITIGTDAAVSTINSNNNSVPL